MKVVVVGNGMVSHRFLETITKLDRERRVELVCFGEERHPAYDRIHLSEYFGDKTADELYLAETAWYAAQGIQLRLGEKVVALNTDNKFVETDLGNQIDYDVLVLATGSAAFIPPVPGIDLKGVFPYRTIDDLDEIIAYGKNCRTATVIGGGLLGLEAAKAMLDLKLETSVVEFAQRLMPRQIDQSGSDLLVRKIAALGAKVLTGKSTKQVTGSDKVAGLDFADGEHLAADMIVVSAGIRPRDELARQAGIAVGERGGIVVDDNLQTSVPDIYAIGECALAQGFIYGLAAPGYRMAESVAEQLLGLQHKPFAGFDMSTKLKLMGVDVASIGDPFTQDPGTEVAILHEGKQGIYKKLCFDPEKNLLRGAILVGDAEDYQNLLQMYLNKIKMPAKPESLLVKGGGFQIGVDALPETATICSCNNISKASLVAGVAAGNHTLEALKQHCNAGTSCGSCQGLVKDILVSELKKSGVEVDNSMCEHFKYTRQELFEIIKIKQIKTFKELIENHGTGRGCEICKPTVASIFASLWNEHVLDHQSLQDSNDTFLANIQRNGSYSVVPRVPGGEITPDQLIVLGQVAKDFKLYTKITGGQRVDLFGAKVEDLPAIWQRLIDAGFHSGHAYAKAVRTVKSCVGSTWCRFGVQDSTALAIELEERYRGLRSPHKLKFGVSGCARECAEAQGKDVGIIATDKGWNLYVCGNGGMKPAHAVLLARDITREQLIKYTDRFLMYYIRTADRLMRTSVWLEKLDGGIEKVKQVVIDDSLGIAEEMEAEMVSLVETYECEWKKTLADPAKLERFKPFVNTVQSDPTIRFEPRRQQHQPAFQPER